MRNFTEHPISAAEVEEALYALAKDIMSQPNRPTPDMIPLFLKVAADYIEADTKRFEDFARDDIWRSF